MIQDVGLSRNNDPPTLPSGFNCCAIGLGARVLTQPGPNPDMGAAPPQAAKPAGLATLPMHDRLCYDPHEFRSYVGYIG